MNRDREHVLGMPVFMDEQGRIAIECLLCDGIFVDVIEHLKIHHESNPVAQRIVIEFERARSESYE